MSGNGFSNDEKLFWYKDAIIYELHIKAFMDGNGDGIGDFPGLLEKLDYLQNLGVTAIWLLPFYPSPLRDDGYDIADYYNINYAYGDISQFKEFLEQAHQRGLKVITELVINHTSDQHPWFQRARIAPKNSVERNFYVWTDDPTQYKDVRIIFQDFENSNWTWDKVAEQYYWHRFFSHQPDLNYDNPLVQEEVFKIINYWCAMGVDGFRLDAVPYLFEREGTNGENLPETHQFLKKLRAHVDKNFPGTVLLAEANMWPEDSAAYFGNGDECHMNYHFPVMPRMFMALQMEDRYPITDIFDQTPAIPNTCQWAIFLRNHDELTLEMVTDEERDYMYNVYAKDPKAKINLGIRHRLAPLLENNRRKIELMNGLLFALPGTPVIYYGDEIGMGDNFYLGDRDGVRTPMQWSPDRNAGFSSANPQKLYLPLILDPEYHYEAVNVETQRSNTSSLYWFMKRMINARKKCKAFGWGDLKFLNVENPKILAFTRCYKDEKILIIVNLSKFSQPAEIDLSADKGYELVEVSSKNRFPTVKEDLYFFTLGPHSFYWFALEKVHPQASEHAELPMLSLVDWDELLDADIKERLENNIFPEYILKTKWFDGKSKTVYSVNIVNHANMPVIESAQNVTWLLIEVIYQSGLPETYQLPVIFSTGQDAERLMKDHPHAVIAQMELGTEKGILCDAFFAAEMHRALFTEMAEHHSLIFKRGRIDFYGNEEMKKYLSEPEFKSKIHTSDQFNTAITYNNQFFLKMYRKVTSAINPDLEVTRFLTEQAKFENIPAFVGAIEWKSESTAILLGIMQVMIENHGDGYTYLLERANNYIERLLAKDTIDVEPDKRIGTLINPPAFEELPENIQLLIGANAPVQARLLGIRTGQMHLALASGINFNEFRPEPFSLHYQQSLFSNLQSIIRETYQTINRDLKKVPDDIKQKAELLISIKPDLLALFKRIYAKKLDAMKIRVHGNFQLGQILLTGKDLVIQDYSGKASQSYSQRRLRRSPLHDVVTMVSSIYYATHEAFVKNTHIPPEKLQSLLPFATMWAQYISGFFIEGWMQTVENSNLIPKQKQDRDLLLQIYLLQHELRDLTADLNSEPKSAIVPLDIILSVINA